MSDNDNKDVDASAATPTPTLASAMKKRPSGLGRGLNALLGDIAAEAAIGTAPTSVSTGGPVAVAGGLQMLAVAAIHPLPGQPRRHFDPVALDELAQSIVQRGLIQPVVVRPAPDGRGYQLVAGERRWRAAQRAQLHHIPAIVRDFDDAATYEVALVENIQRQDLNAIDEAAAYRRLIVDFGHSQDALARLVGKSRSHVANLIRLLDLPDAVQALVIDGSLAMGHARALIGCDSAESFARRAIAEGLSVRKVEALVRGERGPARAPGIEVKSMGTRDADIAAVEQHLSELLGIRTAIAYQGGGAGSLTLHFRSLDQLDMLCQRLSGEAI
jgi:ParB family transcriptional regulator, chromosome partitioning protein